MNKNNNDFFLKNEPKTYKENIEAFIELLIHFGKMDGDDLVLMDSNLIKMKIHGRMIPISKKILTHDDIKAIANFLYKDDNAYVKIMSGIPLDGAYSTRDLESNKRFRFRFNMVGTEFMDDDAVQITIRLISSTPIELSKLGVEKEIVDNFMQEQGMTIITGPTGSGKSTLMASCVRYYLERKDTSYKIDSYDSPIEFIYDEIDWNNNFISQVPIPQRLPNFTKGIEASLRRNPDIIIIGEARDQETISKTLEASQTGHGVITTMHTNGPAITVSRMISKFPTEEKEFIKTDIIESLRLIVSQRLIPSVDGKRVAIKSWLVFTDDMRKELQKLNFEEVPNRIREFLKEKQQNFISDAKRKYKNGLIDKETLIYVKNKFGED